MSASKIRAAIVGGSESGKTFRAIGYSRGLWRFRRIPSIVFDPWKRENDWGKQAWVTTDFDQWKRVVMAVHGFAIFWDEATVNGGRDRDNVQFFSEIRHRHPALFCIGHAYSALLPLMRVNLTDLHLAASDPDDAREWAKIFRDPTITATAPGLGQYEFLHKRAFQPARFRRESAAEIRGGILP